MRYVIKNGSVVFKDGVRNCDILVEDGRIAAVGEGLDAEKAIDAEGLHVFPGLIDMHVHLREPGFEGKEDIESGSRAAVAGGFTQVCCMPNTNPVCDNAVVVTYILSRAKEVNLCKVRPIGSITKGEKGEELAEIGKMAAAGAVAISDDGRSVMDSKIMRLAMEYADGFGLKCLAHCEDENLVDGGVVNEGLSSTITGLKGSIRAAEDIMIAREIALSESLGIPVHICHVSTYSGIELIRSAKARGVKVTAESCPHYFWLTDDVVRGFDTDTKVNPPIREERDRQAVAAALSVGFGSGFNVLVGGVRHGFVEHFIVQLGSVQNVGDLLQDADGHDALVSNDQRFLRAKTHEAGGNLRGTVRTNQSNSRNEERGNLTHVHALDIRAHIIGSLLWISLCYVSVTMWM